LVLWQSLQPVGIGLAAGAGLAAALAILLAAVDSGVGNMVDVFDPVAYVASVVVIVTSCAAAVLIPALRASRIDPIATLRSD
jgi:ABC-type antimicrobial peptide transport system permease subunit